MSWSSSLLLTPRTSQSVTRSTTQPVILLARGCFTAKDVSSSPLTPASRRETYLPLELEGRARLDIISPSRAPVLADPVGQTASGGSISVHFVFRCVLSLAGLLVCEPVAADLASRTLLLRRLPGSSQR